MKLFIASDHAAFEQKQTLINHLKSKNIETVDLGTSGPDSVHYPEYAIKLSGEVLKNNARGILICGTGIGMSIVANKFKNIRATLCHDEFDAKMCRQHNNSNVLCLGARTTDVKKMVRILDVWLETEFEGGRHQDRLNLFSQLGSEINE